MPLPEPIPPNLPAPNTARLFIVINAASGRDAPDIESRMLSQLEEAGHEVTLFSIPPDQPVEQVCLPFIQQAIEAQGVVVAAGGDGTVNAIAKLCYQTGATLAVIPLGTFNYFARALAIPTSLEEAIALLRTGEVRYVSAGFVQDHLFLNNASFGLYPKIIRKREKATARFGRKRIVGVLSALHSIFEKQRLFQIRFHQDGESKTHRTTMVFVGNNSLQLENLGLAVGECTRQNRLAVVILKSMNRLQTARLIWQGIVRNLKFESKLEQFCADAFEIETNAKSIDVVIDGEIVRCTSPIAFRVEAQAIRVIAGVEE